MRASGILFLFFQLSIHEMYDPIIFNSDDTCVSCGRNVKKVEDEYGFYSESIFLYAVMNKKINITQQLLLLSNEGALLLSSWGINHTGKKIMREDIPTRARMTN